MKFASTPVPNLLKGENGTYYARVRVQGKLIWRALETESFTVAKLRLVDKVAELRNAAGAVSAETRLSPKITFGEAMEIYKAEISRHPRLKQRAKEFRLRSEKTLRRTWPALFDMELRRITPEACRTWLARFENGASTYVPPRAARGRRGNSPTTVNAVIAFLRHVFDVGVKGGLIYRNPGKSLLRKSPTKKLLRLPNRTQFAHIVAHIRAQPGWGRIAGDLVEGLAYSGARVGEARKIQWGHIDFEKNLLMIPGEKTESAPRIVPMTAAFRALVERMFATEKERQGGVAAASSEPVFRAQEALGSLATACRVVGVPHMTHHDLRHLFATTCIEAGVDIPTVANWLGHADGGALAMRTYGHIRPEHSSEAAKKVSFAPPSPAA